MEMPSVETNVNTVLASPDEPPPDMSAWEAWQKQHPYGDQDGNGIDLASLRRNLRLTPTERLQRLQNAADSLYELKQYAPNTG